MLKLGKACLCSAILITQGHGTMLQLSCHSLLLVQRVVAGMGTTKPYWNLLAPSSGDVGCMPFRDGYRLPRQLDQESFSSLRYCWPAFSSRWSGIPFFWRRFDPLQCPLGLASHRGRHRYCLSAGMAAYEAFSVLARSQSSWRQVNEWKITFIDLRVRIFRGARF